MYKLLTQWTPDLATDLLWQDHQHIELLKCMVGLHQAIMEKRGVEQCSKSLVFLDSYIENHFGIEEKYMGVYQYPEIGSHLAQHKIFKEKLEEVKASYRNQKNLIVASQLCFDLNEWFINHIKTFDNRLGNYLRPKF